MRIRTALAFAAALLAAVPAVGRAGTCTITNLDVVGDFGFPSIGGTGVALGADVTGGTFALDRTPFDQMFPSPGVKYFTIAVYSYLTLGTGVANGTVDSTGNVVVPNVDLLFGTEFGAPPDEPIQFPLTVQLMSGIQAPILSGAPRLFEGSPIDFATGTVHMMGVDQLNFQGVHLSGPGITCTLSPIPDASSLPAGPQLKSVKGKVVADGDPAVHGDQLMLTAKLKHGATPPVLDGSADVILRLRGADGALITALMVQKGKFVAKGKKLTASDTGGTTIQAIAPIEAANEEEIEAVDGGTLTIKRGKKASTLVWNVSGLDLDAFSGTVNVAVAIGTQTTSRDVTVTTAKKGPKFK